MSRSAALFAQLAQIREAAGVTRFQISRRIELHRAESGGAVTVDDLISYADMVGAEVCVLVPGEGPEAELQATADSLQSKLNDLDELNLALTESLKEKQKAVKSLQAKVRRLEKKLAK